MSRKVLFASVAMIGAMLGLQRPAAADIYLELTDSNGDTTGVLHSTGDSSPSLVPSGRSSTSPLAWP
jgi:hypothetical protein